MSEQSEAMARAEAKANKCPRCAMPMGYPRHKDGPCKPLDPAVLRRIARDNWNDKCKGTDGAWRELGAHRWQ